LGVFLPFGRFLIDFILSIISVEHLSRVVPRLELPHFDSLEGSFFLFSARG
jgi:hypothetical protein